MVGILISLFGCVRGIYYQYDVAKKTLVEYWFLVFPFAINFGWIVCATLVTTNIVVVWAKASAVVQLTVGICSLALLVGAAIFALFVPARPNYTVAGVISWATVNNIVSVAIANVNVFTPLINFFLVSFDAFL